MARRSGGGQRRERFLMTREQVEASKAAETPKPSRRRFLATAAAATAAPFIVPASAMGADGHVAPSNRIAIGLIGVGKQMRGHHRNMLRRPNVHVVALCDVEPVRLERERKKNNDAYARRYEKPSYESCSVYGDFRELVARDDIDAVMIATPNHWHGITSTEALKSGKDVYCEKPLARTIHEGQAMRDTARRYGRIFQTGSQQRSSSNFRFACEMVRNGRIGRVHTVHVNVGGPPVDCYLPEEPVPAGLDWNMWLGPAPYRPYHSDIAPDVDWEGWPNWRNYRDYAGGMMTDWGAHHFDIAQWGLGMDESGPVQIIPPDEKDFDRLTYVYANGTVMYHGGGRPDRAGIEFIGTGGRVMVNRGYLETDPMDLMKEPLGPGDLHLYESRGHHADWLDAIASRKRPICDVAIGHSSATVCHIGNIAYWLNRRLNWDPDAERFVEDDEANRLLSRPMRSPWQV